MYDWSAEVHVYGFFRRDSQGRRGGGAAIYVREGLDCIGLSYGVERVKCPRVRVRGNADKGGSNDVGPCYRLPNEDKEADKISCKHLGEVL